MGTTFLVSTVLEQHLATYHWNLEGRERDGKSYVLEEYLTTPLQQVIEPYTLGALTDLEMDFYAPDRVALHGRFRERPISLAIGLYTDGGGFLNFSCVNMMAFPCISLGAFFRME